MKTVLRALVATMLLAQAAHAATAPAKPASATKAPTASEPAAQPKTAQQMKMKTCNADAKTKALKGEERKKFMSQCLKAK